MMILKNFYIILNNLIKNLNCNAIHYIKYKNYFFEQT